MPTLETYRIAVLPLAVARYFERMIKCESEGKVINPLDELIQKLRKGLNGETKVFRNVYELGIYDPVLDIRIFDPSRDANRNMNRQCLSFMSFKLDKKNCLSLTAIYRNHFYIARLLGNMIGLGRLLQFMTKETGATIGTLTILSTHAEVDVGKNWKRTEVNQLLKSL